MFVVPELGAVVARFISLAEKVQADSRDDWGKLPPRRIAAAMSELEDALVRAEGKMGRDSESTATAEVSRLVDQALLLVAELAELAEATGMSETGRQVELLSIPLVVWSGRRKARIRVTAPVVNALAALANNTRDPDALVELYQSMTEISDAIAPEAKDEGRSSDPRHPWRVLVLNRAIVATRTQDPKWMAEAYEGVAEQLPDYALNFFEEAMGQMDAIGYPAHVRELVSHYYQRLAAPRTVH